MFQRGTTFHYGTYFVLINSTLTQKSIGLFGDYAIKLWFLGHCTYDLSKLFQKGSFFFCKLNLVFGRSEESLIAYQFVLRKKNLCILYSQQPLPRWITMSKLKSISTSHQRDLEDFPYRKCANFTFQNTYRVAHKD